MKKLFTCAIAALRAKKLLFSNVIGISFTKPALLVFILSFQVALNLLQAQCVDASFNSVDFGNTSGNGANGEIYATAIQSDGKIIIAGLFTQYNGVTINRIARINTDGTLDNTFNVGTGADFSVFCVAIQSDGKILIGGDFGNYNGTPRVRLARLNTDGTLDNTFTVGTGANGPVRSIAIQTDGKILIGGSFSAYNGNSAFNIARINTNGSFDNTFNAGTNAVVFSVAIQTDGKILIGGNFGICNGVSNVRIARLNTDGSLDGSFSSGSGFNNNVRSIAIQSDGKILVGGDFIDYNGTTKNRIARLNNNGSLDTPFATNVDAPVYSILIQSDGKIIIGGDFGNVNSTGRIRLARLNTDGTLDAGFMVSAGANLIIRCMALQSDGKIIIGGNFTTYAGVTHNRIARVETNGSLDIYFDLLGGADGIVSAIAIQSDGKIILGGNFTKYNSQTYNRIIRLNTDGTIDNAFNPGTGANAYIRTIAIQSDGKIVVGGDFTNFNGNTVGRLVRLNSDGSLDGTFFSSGGNQSITSLAIQTDGKILVGGYFTTFNSVSKNRIARLNSDGTLDISFNTSADSYINAIALQSDGKIIIGGDFGNVNSTSRIRLARLNTDGTLDNTFTVGTGANGIITTAVIQNDGKILIGGYFTQYAGTARGRIARVNTDGSNDVTFNPGTGADAQIETNSIAIQSDGKIIFGGEFGNYNSTSRIRLARINTDGSLDNTFTVGTGANNTIYCIAIQTDGKILVGGNFTSYNNTGKNRILRIITANNTITLTSGTSTTNQSLCINTAITNITYSTTGATGAIVTGLPTGVSGNFSSNTVTISGTPTASGTFNYTVTLTGGCGTATATGTITVNPNNTVGSPSFTPVVCLGSTIPNINHTTTGATGIGTPAGLPSGVAAWWSSNTVTISGTPTQTGTFNYSIPLTGGCGSVNATGTITVNANPTASISPATVSICSGESTTLTASGGATYAWSNSGGSNATATFTPASTTTYTVTVTASNGCTATASRLVTVNPSPTASISPATVTICSGESATLTASGGGTYAWSNSGGSNAAATFTPASTTTYTVTVTANGCTATASRTVTVNPSPMVSISPATVAICNGESATLTASGGGTYAWSNSGGSNASATFTPTTSTTYTVTVTSANNCTATASRLVTVNANPTATITPPSPSICNGASQTLTASGGTNYSWSNGLGSGASKTVSPTSTTTYTVTVTNAANCSATASATVTVNTVNASINGPSTICSGLSATLTASGGTSYAWSNGGGTNAQATFSPTSTTTYTVTVTGAGGCTATASQTVSVQSQPTASISGPTEVCNGSSVTLTANGGNTYTWSNNQTTAAITVTPTATTTYTVTVSIGANCTATATKTVTVKQPSASSLAETICFGNSYTFKNQQLTQSGTYRDTLVNAAGCDSVITLNLTVRPKVESTVNAAICAGQSYAFNNQQLTQAGQYFDTLQTTLGCDSFITLNLTVNSFVTGSTLASICQGQSYTFNGQQLTQAGQYLDTLTSAGGCDSILTLTLTVNPLPQPTITQNGNVLSTQSFNSYQWQLNGNNINGAINQTYTATQNGNYTVQVTDANGCSNTSSVVNVTGVGIVDLVDMRLRVYPNPTTEMLLIYCDEKVVSVEIYNLIGEQVQFVQGEIQQINVQHLSEGLYTIQVNTTSGKSATRRFIKQ
jgi:uncharacterized delta-60 repeat protein